ncbi:unnamed protein product [Rhizophagus irregularis]|nr:unnamed protein product [Rhizophagus irregularis]
MSSKKRQGRKKNPVWLHFIEGPLLNSSHHEAQYRYCFGKMGGVPSNMLKHLKEECSNITELSDDDNDENVTQKTMESFVDKSIPPNEMTAIYQQLLRALLSANVPFSFVDNPEVIKLFKMMRPSYNLPSRKWISTEILDQVQVFDFIGRWMDKYI